MTVVPPLSRTGRRRLAAWVFPITFGIAAIVCLAYTGPSPNTILGSASAGAGLLERAWPPTLSEPAVTFQHALDTVWMAVAGTALGAALAALLAPLAARNTTPHRWVRATALGTIVACRAIPDVVFAVFFVAAVGIGPLPGVVALGLHSIGMLGRLFTEAVERCDDGVRDAFASTGASRLQQLLAGVLPQAVPSWLAAMLFRLDINVRHSVLLGAVGAGGIGLDLKTAFGFTNYREAIGISLVTVVLVLVLEAIAVGLRGLLLGAAGSAGSTGSTSSWRRSRTVAHVAGWLGVALVLFSAWQVGAGPTQLVEFVAGSYESLGRFLPPDFGLVADILPVGLAQTFAIAVAATALGVLAGVPLGLLAARGAVSSRRSVYLVARTILVGLRSIPDLLLILLFVAMFGLLAGAVAATCALAVFTTAMVAKLVADDAEELPIGTHHAIVSTGAGRGQELVVRLFGHLTPTLTSTTLYALDVNLRAFVVLGVVGAGELGYALSQHIRALDYAAVTAIVLPVFAIVLLVEGISAALKGALR